MLIHWLLAFSLNARAEYRAFELVIFNNSTGQEKVLISTLDPKQFSAYYPVKYDETVTYRSTWMCKGNTAGRKICAQPDYKKATPPAPPQAPATPALDQKS